MDLKHSLAGLLVAAASVPIYAQTIDRYNHTTITTRDMGNDVAVVVSRQPRYVTSYQQVCTQVPVERRSQGGGAVGAILGAAIGNQIGDGRGRDIATAAGAVIGGQMGSQSDGTVVDMQTRCTQQPTQILAGEIVTFEYRGRRFTQVFN
jgi:uncharacterized protein YcfJ